MLELWVPLFIFDCVRLLSFSLWWEKSHLFAVDESPSQTIRCSPIRPARGHRERTHFRL